MKNFLFPCFILLFIHYSSAQEDVLFFQTNWGYSGKTIDFIKKAKDSGYDGIEIWASNIPIQQKTISQALNGSNFFMRI